MRGVYEAQIQVSAVTTGKTLVYITAPATAAIEILSASVTAVGTNVTNQNMECALQRVSALGTPTGTALTASKTENGDQASAATAVGNVTASEPTYTANTQVGKEGAASLGGWRYQPVPEERMLIPPSGTVGLRELTTLTSTDLDVRIVWREVG